MDRINALLKDQDFMRCISQLEMLEKNRVYCKHGLSHLLDVARIGYILLLEDGIASESSITKELFYAAALTHDLGRVSEYTGGPSHESAGAGIAEELLGRHGFSKTETAMVAQAISAHRNRQTTSAIHGDGKLLSDYLRRADTLSRNCFCCQARDTCHWSEERKNDGIRC